MADGHALPGDQRLQGRGEQTINIADQPRQAPARVVKDARVLVGREKRELAALLIAVRSVTSRTRPAARSCALPLGTVLRGLRHGLHPRLRLHVRAPE